jgi:hypothetical protein
VGTNGTFVVGAGSTVNANTGSVVFVNDGAQFVDNRTTNTTFSLLGEDYSGVRMNAHDHCSIIAASCTALYMQHHAAHPASSFARLLLLLHAAHLRLSITFKLQLLLRAAVGDMTANHHCGMTNPLSKAVGRARQ